MKRLIVIAAALAAPGMAIAQDRVVIRIPPPVEPEALEAARELLRASNFDAQMEQSAHQSANATFNTLLAAQEARLGEPIPPDLKATVLAAVDEHVADLVVELKKTALDEAAHIYARHFTAEELRELQRLQSNPVMKKAQTIGPSLVAELTQIGIRAASLRQPKLEAELKRIVADWEAAHRPPPRS